ncbi:olfactomedin-like isoform X2 [Sceloporus undulatus]|uniref:olfactomedin-like isoform X2 n=1 Tax=Sceloporus undulatus TaxID=8520 RepID=UPI001C4AA376|nr:olfactomedin-like isoform X2 [Sceloporus undulatus]
MPLGICDQSSAVHLKVIVNGGHIGKALGVKDASGQCICTMQLTDVIFPAGKVEKLESDFFNLTNRLQDILNEIVDIQTVVATMESHDKNNILAVQRELIALREKLQECEEAIAKGAGAPNVTRTLPIGKCNHDGLLKVSDPVLVKLNWKGSDFKAGSWGKDFAIGTKSPDHYWVFPLNKDERTLENYRLYSSYKKLLLYSPVREYSLNISNDPKCPDCGQGAGVVFFNGSFYYNCFDSRALCKADPFSMRISRANIEDQDPASFNNWFSYKGVKYQDIDLAGDEKGLWMVHGSTLSNGKLVIRKVHPDTLTVGTPWTTSQSKDMASNSFMICGVLYATKRKNSTHEEIYFMYDTNTSQERNIKIFMEKPLPTVQSLNYNPNDQRLYMYNDGYLVYYNLTFMTRTPKKIGDVPATEQHQALDAEGQKSLVKRESQGIASKDQPNSDSNQQQEPVSVTVVRRETMREGGHIVASQ